MPRYILGLVLLLAVSYDFCAVQAADLDAPGASKIYMDTVNDAGPATQAEVGAIPQADNDPEVMFPTMGTCKEEGVQPTDCSQACLYACKDPICSISCLCACTTPEAKSNLVTTLKVQQSAMHREMKLLAVQASMWGAGKFSQKGRAFKAREKHRIHSLMMKNNAAKRQQVAEQPTAEETFVKEAAIDKTGFSWAEMHPVDTDATSMATISRLQTSPYSKEADKIDSVYDPVLDPNNIGRAHGLASTRWWAGDTSNMGDDWWKHEAHEH